MRPNVRSWLLAWVTLVSVRLKIASSLPQKFLQFNFQDETFRVEYLFEAPLNAKGIYFLAHGCSHQATDWFPKVADCPSCMGLPVEKRIVQTIVSRGYVALAASSENREHKCWSRRDVEPIVRVIKEVYANLGLHPSSSPLYLVGVSSGGSFVGLLGHHLRLYVPEYQASGLCSQIMNIMSYGLLRRVAFPPVVFIFMERDSRIAKNVKDEMIVLKVNNISYMSFEISPKPLYDDFFSKYGAELTLKQSASLVRAFRVHGIIDNERMLVGDPRSEDNNWRDVAKAALPTIFPGKDSMVPDASAISELMNLAWGMHEITFDHIEQIIDWFSMLPNLAKKITN